MSGGPNAESGHAPEPVDYAEQTIKEARQHLRRRGFRGIEAAIRLATVRDLLDAGVIVAGPAVTGRIEEQR